MRAKVFDEMRVFVCVDFDVAIQNKRFPALSQNSLLEISKRRP
jgi:hypothetical protein